MTTEERSSRRRRRKRRSRSQTSPNGQPNGETRVSEGNQQPAPPGQQAAGASRRRKRSRRRGRRPGEGNAPEIGASGGERAAPGPIEGTPVNGVLYVRPNGSGVLVNPANNYVAQSGDPIVPRNFIDRFRLYAGLQLTGETRRSGNGGLELATIDEIEAMPMEEFQESRRPFSELISIDPTERFVLETTPEHLTARVLDILSPIGKGQRCLIVAPPKAGKTTLLKDIAHGIATNHPDTILMVLLVDERPEEVTDMRRSVKGEVIASSSDETAENHITIAEVVLERARRLVELKHDVVILCDSITRMSRAYNNEQRSSGKIMSGGIDARTMEKPRRFFGSARNAEDWGSLTIIATALVDTGSRMDEVIFQEFKGTGNTEIVLDRGLFERRIFPAMNIAQSGTRKEEKLLPADWLPKITTLRRALAGTDATTAMKMLLERLQKFQTNEAFLRSF
ncbi:MAG: transcription termination factor Rho [Thermoanaerobaculia bacterium]